MTPASRDLSLDAVGGLEIGAIPLATAISDYAFATQPSKTYDTFIVRKQAKEHGLGKRIEGAFKADARVLVVDDVLTSGGSLLQALHAARDAQLHVSHALVIVDRQEQEGKQKIEAQGVSLMSLLTLDDLKSCPTQPVIIKSAWRGRRNPVRPYRKTETQPLAKDLLLKGS